MAETSAKPAVPIACTTENWPAGDGTQEPVNLRASLFPLLPQLLATYFEKYPTSIQGNSGSKDAHDVFATKLREATSASKDADLPLEKPGQEAGSITHSDLHEVKSDLKKQTITVDKEEISVDAKHETETSTGDDLDPLLEGFFRWLDVEAAEGKYAGVIGKDQKSWLQFLKEFLCKPIGSGIMGQPLTRSLCCNQTPDRACLFRPSDNTNCLHCLLGKYCSNACGMAHYHWHRKYVCRALQMDKDSKDFSFPYKSVILKHYTPEMDEDDTSDGEICNPVLPLYGLFDDLMPFRVPFIGNDGQRVLLKFPPRSQLAAKDGQESHTNEHALSDHVRLLFPAVYDLRNIFETVRNIPDDYKGCISLFLNFAEAKLVMRDLLILELLRYYGTNAIDLAIGLWYSTAITATQDAHLMLTIVRMLKTWQNSLLATGNQHSFATYQQPFECSSKGSTLHADFGTDVWTKLRELVCSDECNRRGFHHKEQYPWKQSEAGKLKVHASRPSHLASWLSYDLHGLLLPYEIFPKPFNTPNRFRYSARSNRLDRYRNCPESGWDYDRLFSAVQKRAVCSGDLHGALFFQLREMMEVFVRKTAGDCGVRLRLMQMPTRKLAEILKNSGLKFHRIDACALSFGKEASPEDAVQWYGDLLAENATRAWPSLLMTSTCREMMDAKLRDEAVEKGMRMKRELSIAADGISEPFEKSFWNAVDPLTVSLYVDLVESRGLRSDAAGEDKSQEQVVSKLGLRKRRAHLIVSRIPGVALVYTLPTFAHPSAAYVHGDEDSYFNLVFSGFTFQERYHEWGWALGQ